MPRFPPASGMLFAATPSQTVGPYFAIGLPYSSGRYAVQPDTPGAITLRGEIYDGRGTLIPDALIETWQADSEGNFADLHDHGPRSTLPGFRGFARVGFEVGDGSFEILTVKPGRIPHLTGALAAPHINMSVFARGTLHRYITRVYFADEVDANNEDPVLSRVPADRRHTLVAEPTDDGYRLDIHLQGEDETVFFSL